MLSLKSIEENRLRYHQGQGPPHPHVKRVGFPEKLSISTPSKFNMKSDVDLLNQARLGRRVIFRYFRGTSELHPKPTSSPTRHLLLGRNGQNP